MRQTGRSIPHCGHGHGTTRLPSRFQARTVADDRFSSPSKCSIDKQYHKIVGPPGRSEHLLSGVIPKRPNPHFSAVHLGSSPQYCSERSNHVGHKQWQQCQLYHRLWRITWLAQWHESLFHKVLSGNGNVSRIQDLPEPESNSNHSLLLLCRCQKIIVF